MGINFCTSMKKVLPTIGIIAFIILMEISCASFFSLAERTYFFLFSFLALSVVEKGFLRALPVILVTALLFEGVVQSQIGPISLYGVLFAYGVSFLLRRLHLEYGGEKVFLALAVGIGMAFYPLFSLEYFQGFHAVPGRMSFGVLFFQNIGIGAIFFLLMFRLFTRFRPQELPLASSFMK